MTDLQIILMQQEVVAKLDKRARARWTWLVCVILGGVVATLLAKGMR